TLVSWPPYARVVRSLVLSAKQSEYVSAAKVLGASTARVLIHEMGPNLIGPVVVLATLGLGQAMLFLAGLSFLGLGVQPPTPEWGAMIADGTRYFDRWWMGVFPGLAILSAVFGLNVLGDAARDALDPPNSDR